MGLVNRVDGDGDPRPEDVALGAIGGNAIDGCERIRWDHGAPPSDHVAVVVVVRRLDQNEPELLGGHADIRHNRHSCQMRGNLTGQASANSAKPVMLTTMK